MWQIPLVLCFGVTIHSTQSLTVQGIVVDMRIGDFSPGQAYVAFSRVTKLSGLHIIGYNRKKVTSSEEIDAEMERIRTNPIPKLPKAAVLRDEVCLSIGHLNIRGLLSKKKHLLKDPVYQSTVLCLSETRLPKGTSDDTLPFSKEYTISRNDRDDLGGGVLVCAHANTKAVPIPLTQTPIEAAAIEISEPTKLVVICVYRPRELPKDIFIQNLLDLLQPFNNKPLVVVGDFNENLLPLYWKDTPFTPEPNPCTKILDAMTAIGFTQLIKKPTHEHGSLLDHIYERNTAMNLADVQDCYFSDHNSTYCLEIKDT